MGMQKPTRWQKASALTPMALLVGVWGAALSGTGLANVTNSGDDPGLPDVPTTAVDQPASVQSVNPAGIDDRAGGGIASRGTTVGGTVRGAVDDTLIAPVTEPVTPMLTPAEATLRAGSLCAYPRSGGDSASRPAPQVDAHSPPQQHAGR